jgi:hypothetical protein
MKLAPSPEGAEERLRVFTLGSKCDDLLFYEEGP